MKIFSKLYQWCLDRSRSPYAPAWLGALSFSESSFFPIPPDVMLAPMVLARPRRFLQLAALTTITSVIGGVAGYWIGYFFFETLGQPLIDFYAINDHYQTVKVWFDRFGVWIVFIAGFTPIPYKLFTIASGAAALALLPFILASLVGRGARFFLVAGLVAWGGERLEKNLHRIIDRLGWTVVGLAAVAAAGFMIWG